jgi:hypothetical protein
MVNLPLHGEIYAVNGDNIVVINNTFVLSDVHMGVINTCMGIIYSHIARNQYVFLSDATLKVC